MIVIYQYIRWHTQGRNLINALIVARLFQRKMIYWIISAAFEMKVFFPWQGPYNAYDSLYWRKPISMQILRQGFFKKVMTLWYIRELTLERNYLYVLIGKRLSLADVNLTYIWEHTLERNLIIATSVTRLPYTSIRYPLNIF